MFSDSKMVKMFAQDPLINGLCLLQCLKSDSYKQDLLTASSDYLHQSSKNIMKAAKVVKTFHNDAQPMDDFDSKAVNFSDVIKKEETVHDKDSAMLSEQERKMKMLSKQRFENLNSKIFQKVLNEIVGEEFANRKLNTQITMQLKKEIKLDSS
mmetsp:Transcript_32855/g.50222  ORF Transcript_32855/g.50222 Transcript_32855/m.50222 type:complete len:153 (+) Transcript_32855:3528-3986(+)